MISVGDFKVTETVDIPFNTFDSNDPTESATVTDLVAGDIKIHKDGSVTQRTSSAGVTVSINFDGVTGNHMVHIDLSDNTHAGFYAAESRYAVRLEGITVDAGTQNLWLGFFTIGLTASLVWDAVLTGNSHNDSTSAGKRLRQIEQAFIHASGTLAAVTDGHTVTLDAGAVATADYYIGDRLQISEGVGAGQSRLIVRYTSGKVATLDSDFTTNPNTSSLYEVDAADVHVSLSDADLAQGFVDTYTNTTTVTLDSGAVANADYYKNMNIVFTHGTGAGQSREITGYTAGRVVTMSPALDVAVDATTVWHIQSTVSREALTASLLLHNIQKNVAFTGFPVVMYLSSDSTTPATGKTVTVQRSIDGGALAGVGGSMAESSLGLYHFDPAQADTNGTLITWRFTAADCDDRWFHFQTVS